MSFLQLRPSLGRCAQLLRSPMGARFMPGFGLRHNQTDAAPEGENITPPTPPANSPYFVSRTPSQKFPVYGLTMSGGNLYKTRVKHVHGDAELLKSDLIELLELDPKDITINPINKHILIKGRFQDKIVKFFHEKNF